MNPRSENRSRNGCIAKSEPNNASAKPILSLVNSVMVATRFRPETSRPRGKIARRSKSLRRGGPGIGSGQYWHDPREYPSGYLFGPEPSLSHPPNEVVTWANRSAATRLCFYSTPEYAQSTWGKYFWIHQGKGSLSLSADSLTLSNRSRVLEIPLKAIKGIRTEMFSSMAKPTGLARLVVDYFEDEWPRTIYLVPAVSGLYPTWETNKLVRSWGETLSLADALAGRVEIPPPGVIPETLTWSKVALTLAVVSIPMLVVVLFFFLIMA